MKSLASSGVSAGETWAIKRDFSITYSASPISKTDLYKNILSLLQDIFIYVDFLDLFTQFVEHVLSVDVYVCNIWIRQIVRYVLKKDLKTPGREGDDEEVKMISKEEYRKATGVGVAGGKAAAANVDPKSAAILKGIGGLDNLTGDIDCCATRLRLTLKDSSKVDQPLLKGTGASGVVVKGNGIQVIYGPSVTIVKSNFEELVEKLRNGTIPLSAVQDEEPAAAAPAAAAPAAPKMKDEVLGACLTGKMLLMNEVEDEAFAGRMLGDGVAIEPTVGELVAPADGEITMVFDTKHAVAMTTTDGAEILMHVGIDTVKLEGKNFEVFVADGDQVKKGQTLIKFDIPAIKAAGYKVTTPCIVTNWEDYSTLRPLKTGDVKVGDDFIELLG